MEKLKKPLFRLRKPDLQLRSNALLQAVLRYALSAGTGFLLSNACLLGTLRPFTVSAASAVPSDCEIWAAFGAALGALLFCDVLGALKYIAGIVLITLLRITAQHYFDKEDSIIPQTLTAAVSLTVCAVAVEAAKGLTAEGLVLSLCEGVLGGAGTFLLRSIMLTMHNGFTFRTDRKTDILVLSACGLGVLSLMQVKPFGFPVANMLAGILILVCGYCANETDGCLAGVCCGCIAGLADDGAYTVISCCAGGLLSALCAPAGRFAAALAYLASGLLTMVANGVAGNPLLYALASLLAGAVFLLLPERLLQKIRSTVGTSGPLAAVQGTYALLDRRLQNAENAVDSFAATAAQVNERIAAVKAPKEEEICHYVRSVCCASCPRQSLCWDHSLAGLRPVFLQAKQQIIKDGVLTPANLPDRLTAVCRKPDALMTAFNDAYARFLQRSAQNKEILAVKKLASTQLRTASLVLGDLRTNSSDTKAAPAYVAAATQELKKADISVQAIYAEEDPEKRIFIHITFTARPSRSCLQTVQQLLCKRLHIPFASPVRTDEKGFSFCFYEQPPFTVRCETVQHIAGREQICGDSAACFRDAKGRFFAVLSDGMGTGERAALDSLMTTGLAQTLLRASLSADCTAQLINAALLLRSRQETVATLDIAEIDLYTGNVKIYKAGASFSVWQKKSSTAFIEQQSLPLGILEETDLACCELTMHEGESLFLLSDGACAVPADFFKHLQTDRKESLADTAEKIMNEALQCNAPGRPDDITCLALRLVRSENASLPTNESYLRSPRLDAVGATGI